MSLPNILKGIAILRKYFGENLLYAKVYSGLGITILTVDFQKITPEDSQKLWALGWKWKSGSWIYYLEGLDSDHSEKRICRSRLLVLQYKQGAVLGVFDSLDKLKEGADYWIKEYPNDTFWYYEYDLNYYSEPMGWDWVYISPNASPQNLGTAGSHVPEKKYFGKNLIGIDWYVG